MKNIEQVLNPQSALLAVWNENGIEDLISDVAEFLMGNSDVSFGMAWREATELVDRAVNGTPQLTVY